MHPSHPTDIQKQENSTKKLRKIGKQQRVRVRTQAVIKMQNKTLFTTGKLRIII